MQPRTALRGVRQIAAEGSGPRLTFPAGVVSNTRVRIAAAGIAGALCAASLMPFVPAGTAMAAEMAAENPKEGLPAVSAEASGAAFAESSGKAAGKNAKSDSAENFRGAAGKSAEADPAESSGNEASEAETEATEIEAGDAGWDEAEVLRRWELEPDDFPEEEHIKLPEIPEELLPYFQEATGETVAGYDGFVPPTPDLRKYSVRATAIRNAVRQKADGIIQQQTRTLLGAAAAGIMRLGQEKMPQFASSLRTEMNEGKSDSSSGRKKAETASAGAGNPSRTDSGSSRDSGETGYSAGSTGNGESPVIVWPLPVQDTAPQQPEQDLSSDASFSPLPENLFFGQLFSAMEANGETNGNSPESGSSEGPVLARQEDSGLSAKRGEDDAPFSGPFSDREETGEVTV
ncbi:MAG: hypothetical protein Q4D81_04655 [Eubacteriales bacterium]|nr:hypothetical protein [Eubacteriales bacterium]